MQALRIAVCHTKQNDHGKALAQRISLGIAAVGDSSVWIDCHDDVPLLVACDALVMVCGNHPDRDSTIHSLRNEIVSESKRLGMHRLIIETGFLKNSRAERRHEHHHEDTHWAAGWDGIKRGADYCVPKVAGRSRWEALQLPKIPTRYDEYGKILVFGQVDAGYAEIGLNMPAEYDRVIKACRRHLPSVPVLFRPHPAIMQRHAFRDYERSLALLGYQVDPFHSHKLLLGNCRLAITWASNASIDAVLQGVPVICLSELNPAWDIAEHDVEKVAKPYVAPLKVRQSLVERLAWCQWSLSEFSGGAAWRQLRMKLRK